MASHTATASDTAMLRTLIQLVTRMRLLTRLRLVLPRGGALGQSGVAAVMGFLRLGAAREGSVSVAP